MSRPYDAFIAAMQQGIPSLRVEVIDMNNNAIEPIRDSALAEEDAGRVRRMDYGTIADVEASLKGHYCEDRR